MTSQSLSPAAIPRRAGSRRGIPNGGGTPVGVRVSLIGLMRRVERVADPQQRGPSVRSSGDARRSRPPELPRPGAALHPSPPTTASQPAWLVAQRTRNLVVTIGVGIGMV